jgi:polyisoprenoid-binding protein YceI
VRYRLFFLFHFPVHGRFPGVTGTITLDEAAPERSSVAATIPTATICCTTRTERLDLAVGAAGRVHPPDPGP